METELEKKRKGDMGRNKKRGREPETERVR